MSSGVTVEKCVDAIKALADHKGSSRVALVKYFKNALHIDNPAAVAAVLKGVCVSVIGLWRAADTRRGAEGVSRGVLTQTGQSFKARALRRKWLRRPARRGVRRRARSSSRSVLARGARRRAACAQPLTHDARTTRR